MMGLEQQAKQAQQDLKAALDARRAVNRALVAQVKTQEANGTAAKMVRERDTQRASLDRLITVTERRIAEEVGKKIVKFEADQKAAAALFEKNHAPFRTKAEGKWWGKEKAVAKLDAQRDAFQRKQHAQAERFEASTLRRMEQLAAWKTERNAAFKASEAPDMQRAREDLDYVEALKEDLRRQQDQATASQARHDEFSSKEAQLVAAGDAGRLKAERLDELAQTKREEAEAWQDTVRAMEDLGQRDSPEYAEAARRSEEAEAEAEGFNDRFLNERERICHPVTVDVEQGIDWRNDPFDMKEANRREAELLDDMPEQDRAAAQASDEKHATEEATRFNQGVESAYRKRLSGSDHEADLVGARTDRYGAEAAAARWTRIAERERSIHGNTDLYRDCMNRRDVADKARGECNFRHKYLEKQHAEGKHRDGYEFTPSWARMASSHRADGHTEKEPPFSRARTERAEDERKARMMPEYAMQGGSAALGRQQQAKPAQQSAETQKKSAALEQERIRQQTHGTGKVTPTQKPNAEPKSGSDKTTNGKRSKEDVEAERQAIAARAAAAKNPPNAPTVK